MPYINDEKELIITWSVEDVIIRADERGVKLTEEQALEVLETMSDKHDCCIGINWDFMDACLDYCGYEELEEDDIFSNDEEDDEYEGEE